MCHISNRRVQATHAPSGPPEAQIVTIAVKRPMSAKLLSLRQMFTEQQHAGELYQRGKMHETTGVELSWQLGYLFAAEGIGALGFMFIYRNYMPRYQAFAGGW